LVQATLQALSLDGHLARQSSSAGHAIELVQALNCAQQF
jgi:hypothetical protein